jgi:hypothetical protein
MVISGVTEIFVRLNQMQNMSEKDLAELLAARPHLRADGGAGKGSAGGQDNNPMSHHVVGAQLLCVVAAAGFYTKSRRE